jgi:hypothetical protein
MMPASDDLGTEEARLARPWSSAPPPMTAAAALRPHAGARAPPPMTAAALLRPHAGARAPPPVTPAAALRRLPVPVRRQRPSPDTTRCRGTSRAPTRDRGKLNRRSTKIADDTHTVADRTAAALVIRDPSAGPRPAAADGRVSASHPVEDTSALRRDSKGSTGVRLTQPFVCVRRSGPLRRPRHDGRARDVNVLAGQIGSQALKRGPDRPGGRQSGSR